MASLKILIEKFIDENKCCLTLLQALVPEVISWVNKDMKLNVSNSHFFAETNLGCPTGRAHGGHHVLDG